MEPDTPKPLRNKPESRALKNESASKSFEWRDIENILDNLKRLEINDIPISDVDADKVKSLLGNLYMELLFPHNDKSAFVNMSDNGGNTSTFDKKA